MPTSVRRVLNLYRRLLVLFKSRILVVEGERLAGIISEADIRADEGPLA